MGAVGGGPVGLGQRWVRRKVLPGPCHPLAAVRFGAERTYVSTEPKNTKGAT